MSGIMVMSCAPKQKKPVYPETAKVDTVDVYFGTQVPDPYRWLENDTSAATTAWVEAQNKVTNEYLSQIPFRENLLKRLTELADYEKISAPVKKHGKYYFSKNDGLQNQSVFYVQDSLDGEPRVFLDPNKLSDDGTVALTGLYFSHDGKYTAYTISLIILPAFSRVAVFLKSIPCQIGISSHKRNPILSARRTVYSFCG